MGQTGRCSEAVHANQNAVALSPQDAEAHYNLGVSLKELGRLEEAEASYTQAIAVRPDHAGAYWNLVGLQKNIKESPKLRTYATFKRNLSREKYLDSMDEKERRAMTRIRSGTNELRIDTGRYEGGVKKRIESRKCWFGCNEVEDEEHFLRECKIYEDFRLEIRDV